MKDFFEILKKAREEKYALGAFNFSNIEQLKAIIQAAQDLKSPVIVATSEGESDFLGLRQTVGLIGASRKETGLPIILHFDHGKSFQSVRKAVEAGYDSVQFDGSAFTLKENIKETKKIVACAKKKEVFVEGELGYLRGKSQPGQKIEIKKEDLTKSEEARRFVEETGIDSLAVAIGNIHGIEAEGINPALDLQRLEEIRKKTNVFLVLHGGSGTPEEDVKKAIQIGIVKININTELRVAYTETLRKSLGANPGETTPYKLMLPVIEAVEEVVKRKIELFGSVNKI